MPPIARPIPRFIADAAVEPAPYGRWAERLIEVFEAETLMLADEAGAPLDTETIRWFPERSWGGRTYVPVTGSAVTSPPDGEPADGGGPVEYFGWVAFTRGEEGSEPTDLDGSADFTDVTAAENPDWQVDLNDSVIGAWRAEGKRGGDVTLVWGLPMVRAAVAATAELDGDVLDQTPVVDGRFTLIAVDAVAGFGDEDLLLGVKLWDRQLREIASESLYD
ncbi:hypothetical protein HJD18_00885 [Thermoleophilia bacterium SCSIO 60948]|nr:hypothetical protein HJD18_00885 [Thermoleophilia bacterium SCSIO 60948]